MYPPTRTKKRRGRNEIAHDVIKAADGGTRKTAIMFAAALNPAQLKSHLNLLIEFGLVEEQVGGKVYRATQKGRRYMKSFERYSETRNLADEQELAIEAFWRENEGRARRALRDSGQMTN